MHLLVTPPSLRAIGEFHRPIARWAERWYWRHMRRQIQHALLNFHGVVLASEACASPFATVRLYTHFVGLTGMRDVEAAADVFIAQWRRWIPPVFADILCQRLKLKFSLEVAEPLVILQHLFTELEPTACWTLTRTTIPELLTIRLARQARVPCTVLHPVCAMGITAQRALRWLDSRHERREIAAWTRDTTYRPLT